MQRAEATVDGDGLGIRREGTHCREVTEREDAQETGLAASAITDDDKLPMRIAVLDTTNWLAEASQILKRTKPDGEKKKTSKIPLSVSRPGTESQAY